MFILQKSWIKSLIFIINSKKKIVHLTWQHWSICVYFGFYSYFKHILFTIVHEWDWIITCVYTSSPIKIIANTVCSLLEFSCFSFDIWMSIVLELLKSWCRFKSFTILMCACLSMTTAGKILLVVTRLPSLIKLTTMI